MKEEGNEFDELYNKAKLQQPIKKIEVNPTINIIYRKSGS